MDVNTSAAMPTDGHENERERDEGATPASEVGLPADAVVDAVVVGDPALLSNGEATVARREVVARKEADQQYRRRQLDEFHAEHADRIHPFDGLEHVGSVVAAALGEAIVHIGRQEYVSVALADGVAPPDVGASVTVDRSGSIAVSAPEHELVRQRTSYERSL